MAEPFVALDTSGEREIIRAFKKLGDAAARRIMRSMVRRGLTPVKREAKRRVPVRSGLLKKALGVKGWTDKRRGAFVGFVGPRRGFKTQIGTKKDGTPIYADPVKYTHLVEFGSKRNAPKPFLRPAIDATKNEVNTRMRKALDEGIKREAAKARAKGRRGK